MNPKLFLLAAAALSAGCGRPTHIPDRTSKLEATSVSIFANLLKPRCVVCHNPQGQARFLDLSSRGVIFAARDRVFAGGDKLLDLINPENSYLIKVIEDPVETMPPPTSSLKPLDTREIEVLKMWIQSGLEP